MKYLSEYLREIVFDLWRFKICRERVYQPSHSLLKVLWKIPALIFGKPESVWRYQFCNICVQWRYGRLYNVHQDKVSVNFATLLWPSWWELPGMNGVNYLIFVRVYSIEQYLFSLAQKANIILSFRWKYEYYSYPLSGVFTWSLSTLICI